MTKTCTYGPMTKTMTPNMDHALRLIVATHGGCRVHLAVARALQTRGYVTLPPHSPKVPRATAEGIAYVEAQS